MARTKRTTKTRSKRIRTYASATRLRKNKLKGLRARHRSARKRKKSAPKRRK
jgi:hypothetical protein